jgi:hypothetical protein
MWLENQANGDRPMPAKKFLAPLVLLFSALTAQAQDASNHPIFENDWLFGIGVQQSKAGVRIGLANEDLGTIPVIDFDTLGVSPDFTGGWLDVVWQGPDRWSWSFNYFETKSDGRAVTDADIEFGNTVIPAGTGIEATFKTSFYVINGFYDFYQAPGSAAGVGFGVYSLDLEASIREVVGGQPSGDQERADVLAPLPTFSVYYKHAFNSKWAFSTDLNYFGLTIDKYDGNIFAASASIDYWFNDRWGVGAGYTYVDLDLTIDEQPFDKLFDVQYDSFSLYLTYGF